MNNDEPPQTWAELKARRPSDEDRERIRESLLDRARNVLEDGWEPYRHTWSSGEVAGVAFLLGQAEAIGETESSVLQRYAGELFGIDGSQDDIANGLPLTRRWFHQTRTTLATRG